MFFFREVTSALKERLLRHFISLPKFDQLQKPLDGFAARGYPMCAGALDGSHISIIAPRDDQVSLKPKRMAFHCGTGFTVFYVLVRGITDMK